jgi:carbon storage regulator
MTLVLSRRRGEAVIIGDEIQITVLAVHEDQNQVKIGITSPEDVEVHREEVYNRVHGRKQDVAITHKRRLHSGYETSKN